MPHQRKGSRLIVSFGDACRSLVLLARRLKPCGRFGRKAGVEEVDLALSDDGVLRHLQRRDAHLLPIISIQLARPRELGPLLVVGAGFFPLAPLHLILDPAPDLVMPSQEAPAGAHHQCVVRKLLQDCVHIPLEPRRFPRLEHGLLFRALRRWT
jgi:hypothetical protein